MKKFNVGEKVIALTDPEDSSCQPRKKGNVYTVKETLYCVKCGIQKINLSGTHIFDGYIQCNCGSLQPNNRLHWTESEHFAGLEEIQQSIEEAVEAENCELVHVLQSTIKDLNK